LQIQDAIQFQAFEKEENVIINQQNSELPSALSAFLVQANDDRDGLGVNLAVLSEIDADAALGTIEISLEVFKHLGYNSRIGQARAIQHKRWIIQFKPSRIAPWGKSFPSGEAGIHPIRRSHSKLTSATPICQQQPRTLDYPSRYAGRICFSLAGKAAELR